MVSTPGLKNSYAFFRPGFRSPYLFSDFQTKYMVEICTLAKKPYPLGLYILLKFI